MARLMNRLTARGAATVGPGLHADGGNLYLRVDESGARRWTFIFRYRGKRCEMGLGPLSTVSLKEAREAALAARVQVRAGKNPVEEKRRQKAAQALQTFGAMADQLIADLSPQWKSPIHLRQWRMTLEVYAAPLRPLMVDQITTDDVLGCLRPIWLSKPETASRTRGRIERVLDAAKAKGLRQGDNPARWRGHLDLLLPGRRKLSRGNHPALPYADLPQFMAELRESTSVSAKALDFTILTVARTSEAILAKLGEVDMATKVWTVPAARMKRTKDHRIPLPAAAFEIVQARWKETGGDPDAWLFPSPDRPKPGQKPRAAISNMAMAKVLAVLERDDYTVHGFRSTFKDWASDCTTFARELIEAAMHHKVGDAVENAYRRGDAIVMRRKLMEAWERFCAGKQGAEIVTLVA